MPLIQFPRLLCINIYAYLYIVNNNIIKLCTLYGCLANLTYLRWMKILIKLIRNLSTQLIRNLSTHVIRNLSTQVIRNLSTQLIKNLSTEMFRNISTQLIRNLSTPTVPKFTQSAGETVQNKIICWLAGALSLPAMNIDCPLICYST